MHASQNGATNVDSLAALWGPRLVRFYFFVCADKPLAEASAIDTLAEALRSCRLNPSALLRLAASRAANLRPASPNGDRMSRALLGLPSRQRLALAFSRGMGVGVEGAASAMSINIAEVKRLLADGLLGLHRALFEEPDVKLENSSDL
ncbi:MAG TPA: hypothetical protein VG897_01040 [Terriglobales bacterium]|nr:hypothetical protein [Terriglobales bacterium]